jgi:ribonuclease HI
MKSLEVYIDGSVLPTNPGYGGWGFYVLGEDCSLEMSGSYNQLVTNNQMEMTALIQFLTFAKENIDPEVFLKIYSDSNYVVTGSLVWLTKWKTNDWKNGSVLNIPLWKKIDSLLQDWSLTNLSLIWVKGHSNVEGNVRADKLANQAARDIYSKNKSKEMELLRM